MTTQVQQRREYGSGQVVFQQGLYSHPIGCLCPTLPRPNVQWQVVFQQGSPADHFYIVNSGELEMSVTTTKGQTVRLNHAALGASTPPPPPSPWWLCRTLPRPNVQWQQVRIKRLKPGDQFGYDALLSERNDTTVTALTPVEVTAVPRHELRLATADDTYFKSTVQQVLIPSLPPPCVRCSHPHPLARSTQRLLPLAGGGRAQEEGQVGGGRGADPADDGQGGDGRRRLVVRRLRAVLVDAQLDGGRPVRHGRGGLPPGASSPHPQTHPPTPFPDPPRGCTPLLTVASSRLPPGRHAAPRLHHHGRHRPVRVRPRNARARHRGRDAN